MIESRIQTEVAILPFRNKKIRITAFRHKVKSDLAVECSKLKGIPDNTPVGQQRVNPYLHINLPE
jgi:hypothetical protein